MTTLQVEEAQNMSSVTVIVNGKSFYTTKETLLGSAYFEDIFELNPEEKTIVMHDRSDMLFEHVLNYLRDNEYPFPGKYYKEMEFYLVEKAPCSCTIQDCYKKVMREGGVYCLLHQCKSDLCDKQSTYISQYCEEHTCSVLCCHNITTTKSSIRMKYCSDHCCHSLGCFSQSLAHHRFCYLHRGQG